MQLSYKNNTFFILAAGAGKSNRKNKQRNLRICYTKRMTANIASGTVHALPSDLKAALARDTKALALWQSLTPLSRNEWICWTVSVKRKETREAHVKRVVSELKDGMRRPCCWIGCIHRRDKKISRSVKFVLAKRKKQ
ncbi:MAG TPA: YdeI/OmpD-associated family protein [Candidatus Paceibacterota bacterium]|nr:YdeI/OmpD-associated family protein [Candidatus Paceibacterota bacterium]